MKKPHQVVTTPLFRWLTRVNQQGVRKVKLMTRKEAAAMLGMSLPTLDIERATGRLEYIQRKPGAKVWITDEAIAEYLARITQPYRPEVKLVRTYRKRRAQ